MIQPRKASDAEIARTRLLWAANRPVETTAAPAYVPDPPALWQVSLALAGALLLQSTLAPVISIRGASPSFVSLIVAWYAIRTGSLRGLAFGLIAGACEDALAGLSGVAWTFATGLAGTLAGRLARTWLADTRVVLVPFAAAITLVRFAAFALFMQAQGRPLALPAEHLHVALLQSALDAAIALALLLYFPALRGGNAHRR
jgi:cell shape-determining protein MreD